MVLLKSYTKQETVKTPASIVISSNDSSPPLRVEDGYEVCVLCGRKTQVRYETPIDKRQHYIEGGGQLCTECFRETYQTK